MKRKLWGIMVGGVLFYLLLPKSVGADSNIRDFDRMVWLSQDYYLPVKGYVVEGYFSLKNSLRVRQWLKEQFEISVGQGRKILEDGSQINYSVTKSGREYDVEIQLITTQVRIARQYYMQWSALAQGSRITRPIGVTQIIEFPEILENKAMQYLSEELLHSISAENCEKISILSGLQMTAYTEQLHQSLSTGEKDVNCQLYFTIEKKHTMLYIGTPLLYQQY